MRNATSDPITMPAIAPPDSPPESPPPVIPTLKKSAEMLLIVRDMFIYVALHEYTPLSLSNVFFNKKFYILFTL